MKKVLVIEDEPEMRRNLTTILRLEKFHPLPAENGRVGVALAKKEKPDLILCDVTSFDSIRIDKMPEILSSRFAAKLMESPRARSKLVRSRIAAPSKV